MTITTKSIPQNTVFTQTRQMVTLDTTGSLPAWRQQLHARGLSDAAITRAGIHPNKYGWVYPIAPDISAQRVKAFPGQPGPKYRWKPNKPSNARFYDPAGDLADHVTAAGGVLILASGEADVWACWSAGIYNVTCTLHGEGTIPPWLVDSLHTLKVQTVQIWPDCDPAGIHHAAKLRTALAESGIGLDVYALPFEMGSKGDLNTLLIDVGGDQFRAALDNCEPLTLPEPSHAPPKTARWETVPGEFNDLYERWCVDVVEPAAIRTWTIPPANGKNLSARNFSAPQREDRNPSAQWNYAVHGFKDYGAGGQFYSTKACAELLGLPPFEEWARRETPEIVKYNLSNRPVEVRTVEHFEGETLNYYRDGIPQQAIELLNGLHLNPWVHVERGDVPNLKPIVALWLAWHELVLTGQHDPHTPFGVAEMQTATGLSKAAIHNALKSNELVEFLFLYIETNTGGKETDLISRGPKATYYNFRPLGDLWSRFMNWIEPQLWRVLLMNQYPELPVEALAVDTLLIERRGATYDDIAAIDDRSQTIYDQHADQLADAIRYHGWQLNKWQRDYIYPAQPVPLRLPEGRTFRNVKELGDLLNELDMAANRGERKGKERYHIQDLTGRTAAAHRESCKRLNIARIPDYCSYPVKAGVDLLAQCENASREAYYRGRIKVIAANGETVTVSPGYARTFDYAIWLENNGPKGAMIQVWERSIEKREADLTETERAERDEISRRQAAISTRRRPATKPKPSPVDTWLNAQGEMRAELFDLLPIPQSAPKIYIDPAGEVYEVDNIWQGIIIQVRESHEQTSPADAETKAQNSTNGAEDSENGSTICGRWSAGGRGGPRRGIGRDQPGSAGGDHHRRYPGEDDHVDGAQTAFGIVITGPAANTPAMTDECLSASYPLAARDAPPAGACREGIPLWQFTGITEAAARQHACHCCGQPAAAQNLFGEWRCEAHWGVLGSAAGGKGGSDPG